MLDTVVISGEDFCCSVVFGTLVGVFVFSVMWSELLMTSAISCPLWSSVYECHNEVTSTLSIPLINISHLGSGAALILVCFDFPLTSQLFLGKLFLIFFTLFHFCLFLINVSHVQPFFTLLSRTLFASFLSFVIYIGTSFRDYITCPYTLIFVVISFSRIFSI